MRVEITPAEIDDADVLEPKLRQGDRDELIAMSGPDVLATLRGTVRASYGRFREMAFAVWLDGELIALFGFIPRGAMSDAAHPWLVASDKIDRIPGILTRLSRRYCSRVLAEYPVLFNFVDARNRRSVRWLKRIGFSVRPAEPFGKAGLPFHMFEMRGPCVR